MLIFAINKKATAITMITIIFITYCCCQSLQEVTQAQTQSNQLLCRESPVCQLCRCYGWNVRMRAVFLWPTNAGAAALEKHLKLTSTK